MEEVERLVRGGEPVLLSGSPMCWAFSTLIELTRATAKLSEVKYKSLVDDFFASGCTRRSGVQDGCSCMSIRGMRGLVAAASSRRCRWRMVWCGRRMVCTRRRLICADLSWQRTVLGKDLGSCRPQGAPLKSCAYRDGQAENFVFSAWKTYQRNWTRVYVAFGSDLIKTRWTASKPDLKLW